MAFHIHRAMRTDLLAGHQTAGNRRAQISHDSRTQDAMVDLRPLGRPWVTKTPTLQRAACVSTTPRPIYLPWPMIWASRRRTADSTPTPGTRQCSQSVPTGSV